MAKESLDNLSVVMIAFKNFNRYFDMISNQENKIPSKNDSRTINNKG